MAASAETDRKRQNDGTASTERNQRAIHVVFIKEEFVRHPPSAGSQVFQFLARRYTGELNDFLSYLPRKLQNIDVFTGDLDCEAHWLLVDSTEGPDISSRASINFDYDCFFEACSTIRESVLFAAADLLQLTI